MSRILRVSLFLLSFPVILYLLLVNIKLYHSPSMVEIDGLEVDQELLEQLAHLKTELRENGAARSMQGYYPEGFVFVNALYGLAWCEVLDVFPPDAKIAEEARVEISWILDQLDSDIAKSIFPEDLELKYGVFYRGWKNYLLARMVRATTIQELNEQDLREFHRNSQELISAFTQARSPYLESYRSACWPADNVVAMASIALYNEQFPDTATTLLERWLVDVEQRTDTFGLIPHSCDCRTGMPKQIARGNSQGLMLNFLPDISKSYAFDKLGKYKELFLTTRVGLPGIREHALGFGSGSDVDSGPVLFGIGGAASIVGRRTLHGYDKDAGHLRNSIEAFGLGHRRAGEKHYLFGALPMADAFIAWANSVDVVADKSAVSTSSMFQRVYWKMHLLSLVLIISVLALLRKCLRRSPRSSELITPTP